MKTFHIEYTLFSDPKHRTVDWEAESLEEAVKELIESEMEFFEIPRGAVRVFKVDGVEIDEEEIYPDVE